VIDREPEGQVLDLEHSMSENILKRRIVGATLRTWDEITSRFPKKQRAVRRSFSRSNPEVISSWILICGWLASGLGLGSTPNSLSGRYVTDSELVVSPEFGAGTPQVFPLELRMNLTDANKSLKGGLVASTKNVPISFSFALTGERHDPMVRIKLEVGICLELPSVMIEATLRSDGSIEVPVSSQVISCNFGRMRLALPRATRFMLEPTGK
jgi:hypothetical protein